MTTTETNVILSEVIDSDVALVDYLLKRYDRNENAVLVSTDEMGGGPAVRLPFTTYPTKVEVLKMLPTLRKVYSERQTSATSAEAATQRTADRSQGRQDTASGESGRGGAANADNVQTSQETLDEYLGRREAYLATILAQLDEEIDRKHTQSLAIREELKRIRAMQVCTENSHDESQKESSTSKRKAAKKPRSNSSRKGSS